ncbi:hypothetical protein NQ176_g2325 [Zarea fungicola]|uniref:Uncharacterized protein n=1 Tax=Zarea fungicola TaxID=93591 RepID=A0ACC1NQ31_9HYPO|nr:hypothetical protein NQ176_g2325 [Lecanicillium fungicola]
MATTPQSFTEVVNDVFYLILEHLTTEDLLALSSCCKRLNFRLDPYLFRDAYNCDRALRWACCKDLPNLVRKAVACGAHVSAPARKVKRYSWDTMVYRTLSLRIAAKYRSLDAFNTLLELGAIVNVQLPRAAKDNLYEYLHLADEVESLARVLTKKKHAPLLQAFLQSNAAKDVPAIGGVAFLDQCLLNALRSGQPSEAIESLLLHGASAERLQGYQGNNPCPLALALIWNLPTMDLLCQFGATLEGKTISRNLGQKWFHIPIFAAARQMHEHGVSVVQKLLDSGIKVNLCADVSVRGGRRKPLSLDDERRMQESDKQTNMYSSSAPMPVYIYLDAITSWEANQPLSPTDGLKFWLRNGLVIRSGLPEHQYGPQCRCVKQKSAQLDAFLMAKWSVDTYKHDEYFHILDMLTEPLLNKDTIPETGTKKCINGDPIPASAAKRHCFIRNKQMQMLIEAEAT